MKTPVERGKFKPNMNYSDFYNECAAVLESAGIENFRNEARWLILEPFQLSGAVLFSQTDVPPEQLKCVRDLCARRCKHEPLQYLLGNAPFGEIELSVTPAVLIPRCETVSLVEHALAHLPPGGTMLDVGCGSGAIALLAAFRRPDIRVTALDKSAAALAVAKENAVKLGLTARVGFLESDLVSAVAGSRFDLIAANLPYVTFDEYAELAADVRDYEPEMALTAPDNGMALIKQLIANAPEVLVPGGRLVLEMSPHQTGIAKEELGAGGYEDISVFADQFEKMRFVSAVFPLNA